MIENVELLKFVYENSEMGNFATTELLRLIKNKENNIKGIIQSEIKEYEKFMKESEKLLRKFDEKAKGTGIMAKMGSKMGISMETMKDNSDSALAQMVVEGLTMGSTGVNSRINKYKDVVDKKVLKIAKNYLSFLENEIERMKKYM